MKKPGLSIRPLTPARWKDFEALFGPRGACAGCWCQWIRRTSAEHRGTASEANKRAMKRLVDSGEVPGLLAYEGKKAVAWAALGPRSGFKRLETSRVLKPVDGEPVWSAPCFFVAREARGKGATTALLLAAADRARKQGAKVLEGYPVDPKGRKIPPAFAWWGLEPAFRKAGFREAVRRSPARPVMRKALRAQ
jgi:GNAT superfamily N-acetyltransferase